MFTLEVIAFNIASCIKAEKAGPIELSYAIIPAKAEPLHHMG